MPVHMVFDDDQPLPACLTKVNVGIHIFHGSSQWIRLPFSPMIGW